MHLVGRLAADVDIRQAGAGTVARLRVATNDTRVAEFHTVAAWGGLTETAGAMAKGDTVEVTGRLRTRSWTGQDGAKRYATEIVATALRLLKAKTP